VQRFLIPFFLLLGVAISSATTVLHYSLAEAVESADIVVRGEVTEREFATLVRPDGTQMPVIRYRLRVDHCYVGDEEEGAVTLLNPGGPIGDGEAIAGVPPGFPDYRVGEEVVVLLERRESAGRYYVPVGLAQGRYHITRTEQGAAFASRGPISAQLIDRRTGEVAAEATGVMVPLSELEAQIRDAAAELEREFRADAEE